MQRDITLRIGSISIRVWIYELLWLFYVLGRRLAYRIRRASKRILRARNDGIFQGRKYSLGAQRRDIHGFWSRYWRHFRPFIVLLFLLLFSSAAQEYKQTRDAETAATQNQQCDQYTDKHALVCLSFLFLYHDIDIWRLGRKQALDFVLRVGVIFLGEGLYGSHSLDATFSLITPIRKSQTK